MPLISDRDLYHFVISYVTSGQFLLKERKMCVPDRVQSKFYANKEIQSKPTINKSKVQKLSAYVFKSFLYYTTLWQKIKGFSGQSSFGFLDFRLLTTLKSNIPFLPTRIARGPPSLLYCGFRFFSLRVKRPSMTVLGRILHLLRNICSYSQTQLSIMSLFKSTHLARVSIKHDHHQAIFIQGVSKRALQL